MFLKRKMNDSTNSYSDKILQIKEKIRQADAVIVGAGAGLSTAAGFVYTGDRFTYYFSDFEKKYGFSDMYSGGFYPFNSLEEYWAWWSKHIFINRYDVPIGKPYTSLLDIVKDKNYFVLTTNVDHQFYKAGFAPDRIFATQGDYGEIQCQRGCHSKVYDGEELFRKMDAARKGIVTKEMEIVAKEEYMDINILMERVANGSIAIPANKNHKSLSPKGVGQGLSTKINVNLGISKDCPDIEPELEKVKKAIEMKAEAIMDLSSFGKTEEFRKKVVDVIFKQMDADILKYGYQQIFYILKKHKRF